jgi:hypothetical protein
MGVDFKMQTFGPFSFNGTTLSGQSDLTESLWDNVATLDSSVGLNNVLSAIRSTAGGGAFKPGSDSLSISDSQSSQTIDQPEAVSQGTSTKISENKLSSSQLVFLRSTATETDPITGTTVGAPLVSAQAIINTKINFQPDDAPVPNGHIKDTGKSYNVTRGYGWVRQDSLNLSSAMHKPLDISLNARDRNRAGVDQRLDTLIHMQGNNVPNFSGVKIPAAWEYALPNGRYSVIMSVGDQPKYNSTHKINVEGVTAIRPFQGNSIHEYERGTVQVEVTDGRLTVDAIGGFNTKLNYLEIKNISSGAHPEVTGSSPTSRQKSIFLDAAVNLDVKLVSAGEGVNAETLNTNNIRLYRTRDNQFVPASSIGTSGGGDAIVYQPEQRLDPSTHYTFRLSDGVKDEAGRTFLPFSTTFSTGTTVNVSPTPGVSFNKQSVFSGAPISSLAMSPNNSKLYATGLDGAIRRWTVSSSGALTSPQTLSLPQLAGRAIIGIAFNPTNSNVLWISHNDPLFPQPAKDFTGKISKLTLQSGSGFNASIQDYVVGLPRSAKDHLSNSLAFHNGMLYMNQGSNSAMGAPDKAWDLRPERLLNAAVLQIDPGRNPAQPFNVQTEDRGTTNYNPYATNAPVKIFATGVRNAYDLVWHSNGSLYVPTNGSAAGGNTPDDPNTSINEGLTNVATQNDYLFKVVRGGYYGHPNPKRQEYIMNGGNPTSGKDPAEVVDEGIYNGYSLGTQPDLDYKGFAYDFGRNRSPNGAIEYKSNTFNGALKNQLLVVEYSGGDRILALNPGNSNSIPDSSVTQVYANLTNPVDLIENTLNGNLYVAELINEETGEGQITLLKPA